MAVLLLLAPTLASAQTLDNKGRNFIMGFLPNFDAENTVEVHLTADTATEVTVQYPVNGPTFDETVMVTPGDITIVEIPVDASELWRTNQTTPFNNAVRAFADEEFVVYMVNRRPFSSDAALALPVDVLNTDYYAQTYIPVNQGAEFVVVAAFDDTDVTVTPTAALQSGEPAGTPISFTLDRGEGWFAISATDLSGSRIEASKPVTLTNGNRCTNVPPGTTFCDHIFEVAQPLASWGTRAFAPPLPNRPEGSVYRVLAADDNTTVLQNGSSVATIDAGEFYDSGIVAGAVVFESDDEEKPIFVTQFMTGSSRPGTSGIGDPAMGNMTPSEQYLAAYTFSTPGDDQFAQHFLSVIAENDDVADGEVSLDGAAIPAGQFTAITGTSFSYAVVQIDEGTHTTSSRGVHGITVEGYNDDDSYLYPGGARFNFINQGEDLAAPNCDGSLDGMTFFGSAEDLQATSPDNTGIFFVVLSDDSENLVLDVDEFDPGAETVSYRVTLDDMSTSGSGTVIVTDGAGNTCSQSVTILVDGGPDTIACSPMAPIEFFDLDPDGGDATYGEFAALRNYATESLPIDLDGCTFLAFSPTTERVTYALAADGLVINRAEHVFATMNGAQMIPSGALPDGPGAVVLARGSYAVGASVADVVPGVVAAVVYRADGDLFGSVRGGEADAEAFATLLAQLRAVAGEDGPDGALALTVAPNPTAGRAAVSFGLAEGGVVRVSVYDALGREVAVLADGPHGPGRHDLAFEAGPLPSGVYVVRVAGADVRTARLTVAR